MKSTLSFILIVLPAILLAQTTNPNLQGIVDVENAFVQMAKDKNTRDAFLYFLTDDAITSGPNGPVKGKEHLKKQPVNEGWLHWEVAYSDISASGDFGYNTGPWEYRPSKTAEKAVAFGEFNSIWKKQSDGTWKNVLDIGIRHQEPTSKPTWSASSITLEPVVKKSTESVDASALLKKENEFLLELERMGNAAFKSHLSKEARIYRMGFLPIVSPEKKEKFIAEPNVATHFKAIDGEVASSNDLGYVYGSAEVKATNKDGQPETKIASYFRVWKKEGKDWKIVLDVLSYQ